MIEGHTSRAFDGALAALHMRVIEMGGLVLDQVREAALAYTEWDPKAAERVGDHARNLARHVQWIGQDAPLPEVALELTPTAQESHSS